MATKSANTGTRQINSHARNRLTKLLTCTVDREIFTRKNIRLLNFVVLFSSPRQTGSVASFLLFDVNFHRRRVPTKISQSMVLCPRNTSAKCLIFKT